MKVKILILSSLFIVSCWMGKTLTYDKLDLLEIKKQVAACMNVQPDSFKVHIPKPSSGSKWVWCVDRNTKDCYYSETDTCIFPERTRLGNIQHCFIHAIADQVYGLGDDPDHQCVVEGKNCYLKCSGLNYH